MNDHPTPNGGSSLRSVAGRALLGLALLAWLGAMVWLFWPSATPSSGDASRRTAVADPTAYVGSRVCAECHPGEYALHTGSGHAQTLVHARQSRIGRGLDGKSIRDPEDPDSLWTFMLHDGRLELERARDGLVDRQEVQYAFGSGHHAVTFVSLTGTDPHNHPMGLEHRFSYFAKAQSLGLTPGQYRETHSPGTTPLGRNFSADETRKCFECHCTLTSDRGNDVLDVRTMIANITCERCHGPARSHVEAARRGALDLSLPFGSGRWTAAEQMALCGQCHRLPEFIPADQRYPGNPVLRRFQSVGLMMSKCYTRSRGELSCITCHDPHARTATDLAGYNAACVRCHQAAPQAVCRVADSSCVDCHMPKREAGVQLRFADHWIRVHRP